MEHPDLLLRRHFLPLPGLVIFVMLLGWVASASFWMFGRDDSLEVVQARRTLRVGYAVEPPYAMFGPSRPEGLLPVLAQATAERMDGVEIEWHLAEFGTLLDRLRAGDLDVLASGLFITPEREQKVAFSPPVAAVPPGLLVRQGNPRQITSLEDIRQRPELRIVTLPDSVEAQWLQQLRQPLTNDLSVPEARLGATVVWRDLADALLLSEPTVRWLAAQDPGQRLEVVAVPSRERQPWPSGLPAFAFRREAVALREAWAIAQREVQQSPLYSQVLREYGFAQPPPLAQR